MNINALLSSSKISMVVEESVHAPGFMQFNDGSPEVEVCEFLYGLVRMHKPKHILETGTYKGVSALVMALGCQANDKGCITTLDIIHEHIEKAEELWEEFGVNDYVQAICTPSLEHVPHDAYDMLFLDSEPDLRFDEVVKFWPHLNPGGIVVIHDLHRNMGLSDVELHGMKNWPFGDFRPKFANRIVHGDMHVVNFLTPRGLTMLYKPHPDDAVYQHLTQWLSTPPESPRTEI